jgi:hypothetical protein
MLTQPVAVLTEATPRRVRVRTWEASLIRAARDLVHERPRSLLHQHGGALGDPMKGILSAGSVWGDAACTLLEAHRHPTSGTGMELRQLLAEASRLGFELDDKSPSRLEFITQRIDLGVQTAGAIVGRHFHTRLLRH